MTISKDAIEHLEQTALLSDVNSSLSDIETKSHLLVVPCGFQVKDLEDHMEFRDSYRMNFKTKSIDDFAKYSEEYDKEGAKCFVDSDSMTSNIIFDLGTEELPEHKRHTAKLQLDKTSAFKRLLAFAGSGATHYQKDAANFIEDWKDFIVVSTSDGEVMKIAQAANAINKMTIESARSITSESDDFSEHLSATERVEVKGRAQMPAILDFTCVPYNGLANRKFQVRLSVLTGGTKPEISLRIIQLEKHEEDIVEEFKEILVGKFKDSKLKTFIGGC